MASITRADVERWQAAQEAMKPSRPNSKAANKPRAFSTMKRDFGALHQTPANTVSPLMNQYNIYTLLGWVGRGLASWSLYDQYSTLLKIHMLIPCFAWLWNVWAYSAVI